MTSQVLDTKTYSHLYLQLQKKLEFLHTCKQSKTGGGEGLGTRLVKHSEGKTVVKTETKYFPFCLCCVWGDYELSSPSIFKSEHNMTPGSI